MTNQFVRKVVKGAKKNSPTLLTITGIGLFGVAIITACRETPKYKNLMSYRDDTAKEKLKTGIQVYWPTAVIAGLGATCLIGANRVSAKRQKALSMAYMGASEALQSLQKHAVERLGDEQAKLIKKEVGEDLIKAHPKTDKNSDPNPIAIDDVSKGPSANRYLIYDKYSNRYIHSNEDEINMACAKATVDLDREDYVSLNSIYGYMTNCPDCPPTDIGDILGFHLGNTSYADPFPGRCDRIEADLTQLATNPETGEACVVWDYRVVPGIDSF